MPLPAFENITASRSLQIPLSVRPAIIDGVDLRDNRTLQMHEAMASGAIENAHLPIAPTDGACGLRGEVRLISGERVTALSYQPARQFAPALLSVESDDKVASALRDVRAENLPGWIEQFRNAGIHAHRSGSPSLLEQLLQAVKRPIDTVICSALDSDPNAPLQSLLAATYPIEFSTGIAVITRLTNARRSATAIGSLPGRWLQRFRKRLEVMKINTIFLNGDYPLSDPTLLLYATLGRKLRPFRLPTDQAAIILDVAVAIAIGRYVLLGEPMTSVPFALHDWRARRARFAIVPIGLSLSEVLRHYQIRLDHLTFRGGDSLRDTHITPQSVIAGSELVVHVSHEEGAINPDPCIRCGWCVEVCPTGVQPAGVLEGAQRRDRQLAEKMGVEACIECGLCSFVCPSKLPLLGAIREIRKIS